MLTGNLSKPPNPGRQDSGLDDILCGIMLMLWASTIAKSILEFSATASFLIFYSIFLLFSFAIVLYTELSARYVYPRLGYIKPRYLKIEMSKKNLRYTYPRLRNDKPQSANRKKSYIIFVAIIIILAMHAAIRAALIEMLTRLDVVILMGLGWVLIYGLRFRMTRAPGRLVLIQCLVFIPIILIVMDVGRRWEYSVCYVAFASGVFLILIGAYAFTQMLRLPVIPMDETQ